MYLYLNIFNFTTHIFIISLFRCTCHWFHHVFFPLFSQMKTQRRRRPGWIQYRCCSPCDCGSGEVANCPYTDRPALSIIVKRPCKGRTDASIICDILPPSEINRLPVGSMRDPVIDYTGDRRLLTRIYVELESYTFLKYA